MSAKEASEMLAKVAKMIEALPGGVSLKEVKHALSHTNSAKTWLDRYAAPSAAAMPVAEPAPKAEEPVEADEEEVVEIVEASDDK